MTQTLETQPPLVTVGKPSPNSNSNSSSQNRKLVVVEVAPNHSPNHSQGRSLSPTAPQQLQPPQVVVEVVEVLALECLQYSQI